MDPLSKETGQPPHQCQTNNNNQPYVLVCERIM
jgi:hypothetical protein